MQHMFHLLDRVRLSRGVVDGLKVTFSAVTATFTGDTTNGSAVITSPSSTAGLVVGMPITGAGIPANTTIASFVAATSVTLSANATATATGITATVTHVNTHVAATAGSAMAGPLSTDAPMFADAKGLNQKTSYVEAAANTDLSFAAAFTTAVAAPDPDAPATSRGRSIYVWMKTDGTIVFGGISIAAATGSTTNGSNRVTALSTTAGLVVGANIVGSGIPALTTIVSIDSATTLTMSANATATATGVSLTSQYATMDGDGDPVAPEVGPDIFSGVYLTSDLQKSSLRKLIAPSVLLAELYKEQTTPCVRDAAGLITTPAVVSAVKIDNSVKRTVLLTGKYTV